jgi:hypothetical protein
MVRESTTATSDAKEEDWEESFKRQDKSTCNPDQGPDTESNSSEETLSFQDYQHAGMNLTEKAILNENIPTSNSGKKENSAFGIWTYLCSVFSSLRGDEGNICASQNSLPIHNSSQNLSVSTSQSGSTAQPPNLLLCIGVGQSGTKVYQKPMNGVNSDSTLFSFMNEAYWTHQRIQSWICLRIVTSVDLVRMSICCIHNFL